MKASQIPFLVILLILPVLQGCVAVVAAGGAAGGVAYVRGELRTLLEEEVEAVNEAVVEAGDSLGLKRISAEGDRMSGKYVYRNAQDEKITITTTSETSETTELRIRIGLFGDQQKSQFILREIRKEL
ncbi:MAG TPA: DUF3568 family protein [Oceanipulchritudo sp.]|nr:DUF3568 family protein [Oceanipulchritudo sp.]